MNKQELSESTKKSYIGKVFETKSGGAVVVIDYISSTNVKIMFSNGETTSVHAQQLKTGRVKNPYSITRFGVGFIGDGEYKSNTPCYTKWSSMLKRCYSSEYHESKPTYAGCTVQTEWHNFQNFGKWYGSLKYNDYLWHLDKDLLVRGNKVYGEDFCVMLPNEINNLISIHIRDKESKLPAGVLAVRGGKYVGKCWDSGLQIYSHPSSSVEECYEWYVTNKKRVLRQKADEFRNRIDPRAYDALVNFEVTPYAVE